VNPLENSTVEFTKTIGNLYFQSGDVSGIIHKKINFFLQKLRLKYFVNTEKMDAVFIQRLSVKTTVSQEQTKDIIDYINHLRNKPVHSDYELKQLNKKIDAFFKD
jgi:ABC-type Zn uptake system ZnuABC Zn-binding protein ZnuA